MIQKFRHSFFLLLFLTPLLAFNASYLFVSELYFPWQRLEQQRFAEEKLGEIASSLQFNQHMSRAGEAFKEKIDSSLTGMREEQFKKLPWAKIFKSCLSEGFPKHELFLFYQSGEAKDCQLIFHNQSRLFGRRPMEIAFSSLIDQLQDRNARDYGKKTNENLLKNLFGSGSEPDILAQKHRSIVTPVIFKKIPSFLLWDYSTDLDGHIAGYFLIVKRNQDLESAALKMAAKTGGLGGEIPGGFIKLFESGVDDCFFPKRLKEYEPLMQWRKTIGLANEENLKTWEKNGFPWQMDLGEYSLFTRIIPEEKHLLFILQPTLAKFYFKKPLFLLNLFLIGLFILTFVKGLILNQWPGNSIKSRFIIVFALAGTLPIMLFIVTSSAYIFDRMKADERMLEDLLESSLLDFDAGKEQIETDYREAFRQCMQDEAIISELGDNGLSRRELLTKMVRAKFCNDAGKLPLAGIALINLEGEFAIKEFPGIPLKDLKPLVGFYGHNIALNLRKKMETDFPDFAMPEFNEDEKNVAAHQAYGREGNSMEYELERFRGRIFRTKFGRGKIGTVHDFFLIDGKPKFAIFVCWLYSEVDDTILTRSMNMLALKNPQVKVLGFKDSAEGLKYAFQPDRSISPELIKVFKRVAKASLSQKTDFTRTFTDNMSILGYSSRHFFGTVLIAGIDHFDNNQKHTWRLFFCLVIGLISLLIIFISGYITYLRIASPLERIKRTMGGVEVGEFSFRTDTDRDDEIGILNREFKEMLIGLKQRQRLASILSDHAVEAISSEEGTLKEAENNGVVLISDIRNFTTLGEQYPPSVLTEMLNLHFAEMGGIIAMHGGRIYKFIGDAIEAVFIDEKDQPTPPEIRSLKASVSMLERLKYINEKRKLSGQFSYKIGIGLASGLIISGQTGSADTRLEYAMLGRPFKLAEAFEAFTKKVPEVPLVIDQTIAGHASDLELPLIEHQLNGSIVFSFSHAASEKLLATIPKNQEPQYEEKQLTHSDSETAKDFHGFKEYRNSRTMVFLAGIACIIFAILAWINSGFLHSDKFLRDQIQSLEETMNLGLMKAVHSDPKVILEDLLQSECDQISSRLNWSAHGSSDSAVIDSANQMLFNLHKIGLEPNQLGVLHLSGGSTTAQVYDYWRLDNTNLVKYIGNPALFDEMKKLLERFIMRIVIRKYPKMDDMDESLPALTGLKMTMNVLYNDYHARVHNVKRLGQEEYFYWQPLLQRNPDFKMDFSLEPPAICLKKKPTNASMMCIGSIFMCFPVAHVKNKHFKILGKSLENSGLEYAIITDSGIIHCSPGFPLPAEKLSFSNKNEIKKDNWLCRQKFSQHDGTRYKVVVAKPAPLQQDKPFKNLFTPILAFILSTWIWYKSIFRQKALARNLSRQLLTGLIAAAIIPISSIYLLNEMSAIDRQETAIDTERLKLIALFEKLERRQLFQETKDWEKIDGICKNRELQQLIAERNRDNNPKIVEKIDKKVLELAEDVYFNEAIIYNQNGWQQSIYPTTPQRKTGEFKRFVQAFITKYFSDLGIEKISQTKEKIGDAVKGEMTRDAGLEIFRNLFGSDAYFGLVHGLDLAVRIFANAGFACMKIIPYPGLEKPQTLFFWLFLDDMNDALRRIFRETVSDFPLFTDSTVLYGGLKQPHVAGNVADIIYASRWATTTKTPVSMTTKIFGKRFRIEARIGRHNEVMLLAGLVPESLILERVEKQRQEFLNWILLSIAAITLLSLSMAHDFLSPIRSLTQGAINVSRQNYSFRLKTDRKDELGLLAITFNKMIKGLQEKELMGKMVSKSARLIASDEQRLGEAEKGMKLNVNIVYIAVPGFATFIETLPHKELIADLQKHIENLSRIIMNHGGDIDKLMGEKILAIFYSEQGVEVDSANMLRAVEQIRNAERSGSLPFPVTIGSHCGEVIAGLLGFGSQRDFTVIGDPVNTAARICSKAADLPRERFLVSARIKKLLSNNRDNGFEFRNFGEVELKGKSETIKLFQTIFRG